MPQNDVLGHVKTKLFLSHLGHNSMYEAAYHGVPIVGFPMWTDQPENARQIARAGMGLWVDINSVTEEDLRITISRVLSEARYACLSVFLFVCSSVCLSACLSAVCIIMYSIHARIHV